MDVGQFRSVFVDGSTHNWNVIGVPTFGLSESALKLALAVFYWQAPSDVHRSATLLEARSPSAKG